jgi:uroporphyrinogen decarboxylase
MRRNGTPARVPFYEHFVDVEVIEAIMGTPLRGQDDYWPKLIRFYQEMGYDYIPFEMRPRFPETYHLSAADTAPLNRGQRGWVDEHGGPIKGWADLESDAWPTVEQALDYDLFARIGAMLPPGMKIIGGASGGPFEHASFLMGLEPLSLIVYDDPAFAAALFNRIGEILVSIAERLAPLPCIGAYRFGDDLGYKTATLLPPQLLREYVFPWYARVATAVHRAGKPFVLHSCGNLEAVMNDIIATGVDAKHSFEDVIMPVTEAKKRWGSKVAILGGIDVDFLCRATPAEVRDYTLRTLEACAPGGGYALGSGNTIANYVPVDNYLAMLAAGREFNG